MALAAAPPSHFGPACSAIVGKVYRAIAGGTSFASALVHLATALTSAESAVHLALLAR